MAWGYDSSAERVHVYCWQICTKVYDTEYFSISKLPCNDSLH